MPQLYKIGSYIIFFWSNENMPLEPIHVHISEGKASANATKIWITSTGKAILKMFITEGLSLTGGSLSCVTGNLVSYKSCGGTEQYSADRCRQTAEL